MKQIINFGQLLVEFELLLPQFMLFDQQEVDSILSQQILLLRLLQFFAGILHHQNKRELIINQFKSRVPQRVRILNCLQYNCSFSNQYLMLNYPHLHSYHQFNQLHILILIANIQMIESFKKDLYNKLHFKASSKISPEALLVKSFKFFDLTNQGFVNKNEFLRVISKIGVVINSPEEMNQIFEHYQHESKINYISFIEEILSKPPETERRTQLAQSQQKKFSQLKQTMLTKQTKLITVQNIINHIKQQLRQGSVYQILELAVMLKDLDSTRTHYLNQQKVGQAFPYLKSQHINKIFNSYTLNKQCEINYAQLIYSIRQNLNPQNQQVVNNLFLRFDNRNQGEIDHDILIKRADKNEQTTVQNAIQLYCRFQAIDDGVFTQDDFLDFFGFFAFHFTTSTSFIDYLNRAYPIQQTRSIKSSKSSRRQFESPKSSKPKSSVNLNQKIENPSTQNYTAADFKKKNTQSRIFEEIKKTEKAESIYSRPQFQKLEVKSKSSKAISQTIQNSLQLIIIRMRKRLATKGSKGFLLFEKALRSVDVDQDSLITLEEFRKVIKDLRIDIAETQVLSVFQIFDQQSLGLMNYPELLFTTHGQVPQSRKKLIQRVWERVRESEEATSLSKVKQVFNARNHPDVKNARRYEEQIIKELTQTIFLIQDLNGIRNDIIKKQDFFEYMENLSYSILEDPLFETVIANVWRINSESRIQDTYAGSRKYFDDKKNSYLIDHHRYFVNGGTVSQNAPFGTYNEPTNYTTTSRRFE